MDDLQFGSFFEEGGGSLLHGFEGQPSVDGPVDEDPSQVVSFDLFLFRVSVAFLDYLEGRGDRGDSVAAAVDGGVPQTLVEIGPLL